MIKLTTLLPLALALSIVPAFAQFELLDDVVERLGGAEIDSGKGVQMDKNRLLWEGGIHMRSDTMEVFADKAEYILETEDLKIDGDVTIYKDGQIFRGESAIYNTQTQKLDTSNMSSSLEPQAPLLYRGGRTKSDLGEIKLIETEDAYFTTHDSSEPNFHLTAKEVKIFPDDRVVFKNLKVYAGDTPVFWLPYLSQPLSDELGYMVVPGYRSNLGAFLLNQYGFAVEDHTLAKLHLDGYSARGVGGGLDLISRRHKDAGRDFGKFKFYWVSDSNPQENGTGSSALRENLTSDRYRVNLQHRVYLPGPEESDFYVDLDINKLSDEFFYEDFFPWEFRDDPQPDNLINIVKQHDRGELSIMARAHLNKFFAGDERLPEIALDFVTQPIANSGFFYTGTSSFGVLEDFVGDGFKDRTQKKIDELNAQLSATAVDPVTGLPVTRPRLSTLETQTMLDELKAQILESKFNRFHTYHEISYPTQIGGALSVVPKVGVGFTSYSSVSGPKPLDSSRALVSAGLDSSFKFSRVFEDVNVPKLGLDGLRHTIQPYLNWSFVGADNVGDNFRGIDRLVASTRPRPLDVANYTAIDSLRSWNILRAGVYNRFQTKRNDKTYNWLTTNSYFDTFIDDPEFDRQFSNLYNDIEWMPLPWMRLTLGSQLPAFGSDRDFTEVNTRLTFMPNKNLEFTLGNRVLQNHPFFEDSNLIDFRAYARLSDQWGFDIYERYEVDDGTLEMQQYTLHRDLTSWAASFGAIVRDNRGEKEYGLILSLTLKDFPGATIPLDIDPNGGSSR